MFNTPTVFLILSLLSTISYSNTFSVPFLFDDIDHIPQNPLIKDLSHFWDLSSHRYIGFLSFALNYQFGGLNVFGYHLVNLLIHMTNGFLVYFLVRLLLRSTDKGSPSTTAPWIAFFTSLLFISHPIQTQAVTYIVQRFASLATLFYLFAVISYLKWRIAPPSSHAGYLWYAGALVSVVLAMKTKEIGFTLPFMILLVEIVFFRPLTRSRWVSLIPFLLTLPIIPFSLPGALGETEGFARETSDISRSSYLFTEFRVMVTYFRLLVFPINQNFDYDYPLYHSLLQPPVFLSFIFLSALFAAALCLLFASDFLPYFSRLMAFGILWFFLTLSVESSIIPIRDVIFEHRLYLPSAGFLLSISSGVLWTTHRLSHRWRWAAAVPFLGLIFTFSVATYHRNQVWRDDLTLWSDVVRKSPSKARPYNGLGMAYERENRLDEAIIAYKTAKALAPSAVDPPTNLGRIYQRQGKLAEAILETRTALRLDPNFAPTHHIQGLIYSDLGHLEEALSEYRIAVRLNPYDIKPRLDMALAYAKQRRFQEALQENQMASRLEPDNAEVYNNLGQIYSVMNGPRPSFDPLPHPP
jgi:tetratricopeptide (TPR) repeat protein